VRELSPEEGTRLKPILRRAKYQSKRQRAMILLGVFDWHVGASDRWVAVLTDEPQVREVPDRLVATLPPIPGS